MDKEIEEFYNKIIAKLEKAMKEMESIPEKGYFLHGYVDDAYSALDTAVCTLKALIKEDEE